MPTDVKCFINKFLNTKITPQLVKAFYNQYLRNYLKQQSFTDYEYMIILTG